MKKIILILFLFISLYFFPINVIYAQDIADNIPVLTCGVAGDVTGKDKCCNLLAVNIPGCSNDSNNPTSTINEKIKTATKPLLGDDNFIIRAIDKKDENCQKLTDFTKQTGADDNACITGNPTSSDFSDPNCKCVDPNAEANVNTAIAEMCYKYLGSSTQANELKSCLSCSSLNGIWTGLGCLSLDIKTLISSFILTTGIGIGGGFALLCIIYSAFMMQSSQGNPEKLKKAQEMITSCIMGLMLIIFSVLIMKIIGVNILRIPGFGG